MMFCLRFSSVLEAPEVSAEWLRIMLLLGRLIFTGNHGYAIGLACYSCSEIQRSHSSFLRPAAAPDSPVEDDDIIDGGDHSMMLRS